MAEAGVCSRINYIAMKNSDDEELIRAALEAVGYD
jgi:hypothetical protein